MSKTKANKPESQPTEPSPIDKGMAMLTVYERMILLNVLPKQSDYDGLVALDAARNTMQVTDEEHEQLNMQRVWKCQDCEREAVLPLAEVAGELCKCGGRMILTTMRMWDLQAMERIGARKFYLGDIVIKIIEQTLKQLNSQKKLSAEHMSLYGKFVKHKDPA